MQFDLVNASIFGIVIIFINIFLFVVYNHLSGDDRIKVYHPLDIPQHYHFPEIVTGVIEISGGDMTKYEVDEISG